MIAVRGELERGLQDHRGRGAVVVRARRGVHGVEVRAHDHGVVGPAGRGVGQQVVRLGHLVVAAQVEAERDGALGGVGAQRLGLGPRQGARGNPGVGRRDHPVAQIEVGVGRVDVHEHRRGAQLREDQLLLRDEAVGAHVDQDDLALDVGARVVVGAAAGALAGRLREVGGQTAVRRGHGEPGDGRVQGPGLGRHDGALLGQDVVVEELELLLLDLVSGLGELARDVGGARVVAGGPRDAGASVVEGRLVDRLEVAPGARPGDLVGHLPGEDVRGHAVGVRRVRGAVHSEGSRAAPRARAARGLSRKNLFRGVAVMGSLLLAGWAEVPVRA